jgi:hypothetical protein
MYYQDICVDIQIFHIDSQEWQNYTLGIELITTSILNERGNRTGKKHFLSTKSINRHEMFLTCAKVQNKPCLLVTIQMSFFGELGCAIETFFKF